MTHTARLRPEKVSSESIADIASLCKTLSIDKLELEQALALTPEQRYKQKDLPKRDGSSRAVHNPHHLIRKIQRRINRRIFANSAIIKWPAHIFGSIPNDDLSITPAIERDYVNCVRQHCGAKSVLSVDIKDFFDNIHRSSVVDIFIAFLKYPNDVSDVLADICCKGEHIVQGALTSSYIASLCLHDCEGEIVRKLHYKGLTYTRLVDDISISSKISRYNFGYALSTVEQMLNDAGLPLNASKTKTQYSSMSPLIIHGLRIDFDQPRLPPDEPGKIRASVKNLELLAASPGYRASRAYRRDFNRCVGRVNKLGRVKHNHHPLLLRRLRRILPLPSHKDIERAEQQIARLQRDSAKPGYTDSYWFYKRYYAASEKLGILKRSFPAIAAELRGKLRKMKPATRYE